MNWDKYGADWYGASSQQPADTSQQSFQTYNSGSHNHVDVDKIEEDYETKNHNYSATDRRSSRSGGERRSRRVGVTRPTYSTDSEDSKETKRRQGKKHADFEKPDPVTAAKNKASRERQRRERLNESFVELVRTLDPNKSPKAEKTTIIADTIKFIGSMRHETDQLRNDKQTLQDELATVEKDKQELIFQRRVMESQLQDMRLALYGGQDRLQQAVGQADGMGMAMDINRQATNSPSPSGIARMFQNQASLQGGMQDGMQPLPHTSQSMIPPQQQPPPQQPPPAHNLGPQGGSGTSFPHTPDFLDLDLAMEMDHAMEQHPDGHGMSMSPVLWLGAGPFDPHADASYMSSNL